MKCLSTNLEYHGSRTVGSGCALMSTIRTHNIMDLTRLACQTAWSLDDVWLHSTWIFCSISKIFSPFSKEQSTLRNLQHFETKYIKNTALVTLFNFRILRMRSSSIENVTKFSLTIEESRTHFLGSALPSAEDE